MFAQTQIYRFAIAMALLCAPVASAQLPSSFNPSGSGFSPAQGTPVPPFQQFNQTQATMVPPPGFDPYASTGQTSPGFPSPGLPSLVNPGVLAQPVFAIAPIATPVRFVLSGEFLYLRASDAAMTSFAVPVNGAIVPPPTPAIPMGEVAAIDFGFEPGFRVAFDWVWNDYSRWVVGYTSLGLSSSESRTADPTSPLALQSLVLHPSTAAANSYYLDATATGELNIQLADVEYRRIFVEDWYRWDFLVGMRYAHLEQEFLSEFTNSTTIDKVDASVDFDGGGIRFGTRGDWRSNQHGFFLYAQGTTSFVAGRFHSRYQQSNSFLNAVVQTSRKDDRIVNISDAELGIGWRSPTQRFYFSGGYLFNTWSDVVSNAGVIRAAQSTSFAPIRERLTLDGLTVRGEFRF